MTRDELLHVLRAASRIVPERTVIVLGSQAILGTYNETDLPETASMSMEVDLAYMHDDNQTYADTVDAFLGEDSHFHREFGYYGQGVGLGVAVLPDGWQERLVPLASIERSGPQALCLDAHDLVIAKLIAYREKDLEFSDALISANLVSVQTLSERLNQTSTAAPIQRERVRVWLSRRSH